MPRHQLPTYSPLTARGLARALVPRGHDPREELRRRLVERYGARDAVLCGSGTQALTLALRLAGREGRPPLVALPAYACYDLVSAAVGADARIVFYDVDPATLSPEPSSLAEACAHSPDAVVVAPLFGIPVDWDRVEEIVRRTDALLVEDAAQALGAEWRGRPLGSLGDVSVLSFGRGKGWTGGAGGALLLHARHVAVPRLQGRPGSAAGVWIRSAAQWLLGRPALYWLPAGIPALGLGETVYHPPEEPAPMPRVAASLALETEERSLAEVDVRRGNAALFLAALEDRGSSAFAWPLADSSFGTSGYLRLPLLAPERFAALRGPKARALGIMPGYPKPLDDISEARTRALSASPGLPGAKRLARELVTLPTHSLTTAAERERIVARLRDPRPE